MEKLFDWEIFAQFGLGGLILGVGLVILIFILKQNSNTISSIVNRMSTDHKESNEAWRKSFEHHSNRADDRQAETNAVLRDLTKVMSENNSKLSQTIDDVRIQRTRNQ